jgi:hypothetical protein
MLIAPLFALALAVADEPVATSPAARPAPAESAAPGRDPDIPASAPTDDYGFVAWCHGALSGHMELHDKVKPELDKVSPGGDDTEQLAAGRDYLALYARALKAAEAASPTNIHARGDDANAAGYRIWSAARAADPRTQMWSYLMWELPARCEIAAKRLEDRSVLFGEALRTGETAQPAPPSEGPPPPVAAAEGLRGPQ